MQQVNYTLLGRKMAEASVNDDRETVKEIIAMLRKRQTWRRDVVTLEDLLRRSHT